MKVLSYYRIVLMTLLVSSLSFVSVSYDKEEEHICPEINYPLGYTVWDNEDDERVLQFDGDVFWFRTDSKLWTYIPYVYRHPYIYFKQYEGEDMLPFKIMKITGFKEMQLVMHDECIVTLYGGGGVPNDDEIEDTYLPAPL